MYRILGAKSDTYITNKVISNKIRATDANVGQAGTLDLFKLFEESTLPGSSSNVKELSRLLIKFDLNPLRALTGSILDISHGSFDCRLKLFDIIGGQTVPSNYNLIVFPLSKSFDEGVGRDIVSFADLDVCNFITASYANSVSNVWTMSGANQQGLLGDANLDIISSGNLNDGAGIVDLFTTQTFTEGSADLYVDVTTIVSATLAGLIPDHGFRISYSGTLETDSRTLFVKRFASRHSTQVDTRPQLIVRYDDSQSDDTRNFFFDITGSVFLNNYHRGTPSNILSGAQGGEIAGTNSLKLRVVTGSFEKIVTASQHRIGQNFITGVYSASFALSSYDTSVVSGTQAITDFTRKSGSITFDTTWASFANTSTVPYFSSSLEVKTVTRNSFVNSPRSLVVSVTNALPTYLLSEKVRFRVFVAENNTTPKFSKLPIMRPSVILENMYYRVLDSNTDNIIIPFDTSDAAGKSATKLSTDSDGMYFDLYMDDLSAGRVYRLEFSLVDRGATQILNDSGTRFRVDA